MPSKIRRSPKFYWRANLNNGTKLWFNHATGYQVNRPKGVIFVPPHFPFNNNQVHSFLNRVRLNTNQGVHWKLFMQE